MGLAFRPQPSRRRIEGACGLLLVVEPTQLVFLPGVVDIDSPLTAVLVPAHPDEVRLAWPDRVASLRRGSASRGGRAGRWQQWGCRQGEAASGERAGCVSMRVRRARGEALGRDLGQRFQRLEHDLGLRLHRGGGGRQSAAPASRHGHCLQLAVSSTSTSPCWTDLKVTQYKLRLHYNTQYKLRLHYIYTSQDNPVHVLVILTCVYT